MEGLVGAGRFELPTTCAQGRCATRLRYAPADSYAAARRNIVARVVRERGGQASPVAGGRIRAAARAGGESSQKLGRGK